MSDTGIEIPSQVFSTPSAPFTDAHADLLQQRIPLYPESSFCIDAVALFTICRVSAANGLACMIMDTAVPAPIRAPQVPYIAQTATGIRTVR